MKPILCLDFDGVIHSYTSGWKGAHIIPDPPIAGVGAYLLQVIPELTVAIHSSRSRHLRGRWAMKRYVRAILRDACLADSAAMGVSWEAVGGSPPDWIPWTGGDVNDAADIIFKAIRWPLFKPAALMTIDDRAVTFNGDWSDISYSPNMIRMFKPWNKRDASTLNGATQAQNRSASQTQISPTAST